MISHWFNMSIKVKISLIFTGAFIFLAGLAWRDAVQLFMEKYIPSHDILVAKVAWAFIITFLVIIFLYYLDEHILGIDECDKK